MFKRPHAGTAVFIDNVTEMDEFATSVVKLALAELEVTGVLVPFVLLEREGRVSTHPMAALAVTGTELVELLDMARLGMRSIGRDVLRYAFAWPGKVVDGGTSDAVFVECAAQGRTAGIVVTCCFWNDPVDGELTTDLVLRHMGSAPVRPNW